MKISYIKIIRFLSRHSDSALTNYVNQNINEYLEVTLQISNGVIYDENVAISVLNNP